MAIIETLELRFQASMGDLNAQLNGLAERIGQLSAAFEGGQTDLAAGAAGMIAAVASALQSNAALSAAPAAAAEGMRARFVQGLIAGQADAAKAAQTIVRSANFSNAGASAQARSAGLALGQGFAGGISSSYGAVMSAANRIANAAVARIRSALKIHSPSKVSWEMGGFFGEGFAEGICASVRMAQQSVGALSAAALDALPSRAADMDLPDMDADGLVGSMGRAVQDALGGTKLVIPMYVDGMKLGEASIQGINRVTRSTGRMMLEI